MQDAHAIARSQRERRAYSGGLLTTTVIEGARHFSLLVQAQRTLLGGAHQEHVSQQRPAVSAGKRRRLLAVLLLDRNVSGVRGRHVSFLRTPQSVRPNRLLRGTDLGGV